MSVATQERPLVNSEPTKVARAVVERAFRTPNRHRGIWWFKGNFWVWVGGEWRRVPPTQMREDLWLLLEDAYVMVGGEGEVVKRYAPNKQRIDNVMEGLVSVTKLPFENMPVWLGEREESPDLEHTVAFEDKLVTVTPEGFQVRDRDERWFDSVVVKCRWEDGDQGCPRWMRALEEWGEGDPAWAELLRRWMGYCLMPTRKYARWLLKYGKIRGGKGVSDRVLESLVGEAAFVSRGLDDLVGFDLHGIESARVLNTSEVQGLDGKEAEKCARVLKMCLGGDNIYVKVNYEVGFQTKVRAAPQVSANEIPNLPNKGMGLSGKMLVLPFDVSFLNREEYDLEGRLRAELPGIARWAMEGALALEQEKGWDGKWPTPRKAEEVRRLYHLQNNFIDAFLEARFVKVAVEPGDPASKGFVPSHMVRTEFEAWKKENKITTDRLKIPYNMLMLRIEQESTWGVFRYRTPTQTRGLKGLSLRREVDDEL
jgi:putative DNA primase/helicase